MEDEGEMEFSESELALDSLPFDCIACVCEYLSPEDLCRFGAACKVRESHFVIVFLGGAAR